MSSSAQGYTEAGRIVAHYIGKVLILCPDCGTGIKTQQNWNTWKVRCQRCHTILLCGVWARRVATNVRKRKYVAPVDQLMPIGDWRSGEPANVLLSDDDDSLDND
jgi:RNase P subunit RPR2